MALDKTELLVGRLLFFVVCLFVFAAFFYEFQSTAQISVDSHRYGTFTLSTVPSILALTSFGMFTVMVLTQAIGERFEMAKALQLKKILGYVAECVAVIFVISLFIDW